ncbi:hypothetical protein [Nitrosomonas oligotropha]|uniref:hypothetical protein n=1 Tax=Nitrosomonas oligotropha TaxID=42354 RepID=UPI0013680579|nr:hypothetical protein [Nitrosomonas oligotropha]MXS83967.1 hypothetical protein [Nitrosomonas oligotropha]
MANITGNDIQGMVSHWTSTPENGYYGSDYGQDLNSLLHLPQANGSPDAVLQKLRSDVPALQILPSGSINLYSVQTPPDKLDLMLEVAGISITVPNK